MTGIIEQVEIKGIATAIPKQSEALIKYSDILGEKKVKRQIKITGIERRHLAEKHQKASVMGRIAAECLLEKLKWDRDSIHILVFVTQTPDYQLPATAMLVHRDLGLPVGCMAFDINLGCSGFTAGLQIVGSLLKTYGGRALLLAGDLEYFGDRRETEEFMENLPDWMLFGYGISAAALEAGKENLIYSQFTNGTGYDLIYKHFNHMPHLTGDAIFSFTINEVADSIKSFRQQYNLTEDQIDYYVFHQAQKMILENLADICDIPMEKVLMSLREYGNTSSASIPLTLSANQEQLKKKEKIRIFLCGFGVGLSWGIVYTQMDSSCIFPIIETEL